jgi:hypothetical protein
MIKQMAMNEAWKKEQNTMATSNIENLPWHQNHFVTNFTVL